MSDAITIRRDITIYPADEPNRPPIGWKLWWCEDSDRTWAYPDDMPEDLTDHIKVCPQCLKAFQMIKQEVKTQE